MKSKQVRTPAEKSLRQTVLRSIDFPAPKKITADDLEHICEAFRIASSDKKSVKDYLDELVTALAVWRKKELQQPDRRSDADRLGKAYTLIKKATVAVERLGPQGLLALQQIAPDVALMFSGQWLRDKFPNDDFAPQPSTLPAEPRMRFLTIIRGPQFFIEEQSFEARQRFVTLRAKETIVAALNTFDAELDRASRISKRQPGSRGGRKPLRGRHYLILNLAQLWNSLNKPVSGSPGSQFAAFAGHVTVGIGWPDSGLTAAVPDAVRDWRHLTQKKNR
jgi:hypothetical protein